MPTSVKMWIFLQHKDTLFFSLKTIAPILFLPNDRKREHIQPASALPILAGLCLCIGRKRQIHGRNSCRPTLFFVLVGFWDDCRNRANDLRPYCRTERQAAGHPCHSPWNVQSISKGRHGAVNPLAVQSLLPWSVRPAIVDAHIQRTDYQNLLIIRII